MDWIKQKHACAVATFVHLKLIYDSNMCWAYVFWCRKAFVIWCIEVWCVTLIVLFIKYVDCVIIFMSALGSFYSLSTYSTNVVYLWSYFIVVVYRWSLLDYNHLLKDESLICNLWVMIYKCQMIKNNWCIYEDTRL